MPILVDGNNLLHAARQLAGEQAPPGRAWLCLILGQWAERYRQELHIVFDGAAPPRDVAVQIDHPAIEVSYSGAGVTADEVVIEAIGASSAPKRLIVVSTDRELRRAARRRRAVAVRADDFWRQVQEDLARPPRQRPEPRSKYRGLSAEQTERWLREFGFDPDAEE